jgi:hypothetical protein
MTTTDSPIAIGLRNPTSPDKKYLLSMGYGGGSARFNAGVLADLLICASNIDTNSNAVQTINTTALTRYTDGVGVLVIFENVSTSATGSTPSNLTITKYTNQAGVTLQATAAYSMTVGQINSKLQPTGTPCTFFVPPAVGDWGIRSVEEVQLSVAMGTASRPICVELFKPLCFMPPIYANYHLTYDLTQHVHGLVELVQSAGGVIGCLNVYADHGAASNLHFAFETVDG